MILLALNNFAGEIHKVEKERKENSKGKKTRPNWDKKSILKMTPMHFCVLFKNTRKCFWFYAKCLINCDKIIFCVRLLSGSGTENSMLQNLY